MLDDESPAVSDKSVSLDVDGLELSSVVAALLVELAAPFDVLAPEVESPSWFALDSVSLLRDDVSADDVLPASTAAVVSALRAPPSSVLLLRTVLSASFRG